MSREAIITAVSAASASKATHHDERCPKCRQTLKISAEQLKRAAPKPPPPGEVAAPGNTSPAPDEQKTPEPARPPAGAPTPKGKAKSKKSK